MKKHNLHLYGQNITVYEINEEETTIEIKGLQDNPEKNFFMRDGKMLPSDEKRQKQMYYAEGHTEEKDFIVIAENIDQKQLANIFISFGVTEASYISMDITGISIEDLRDFQEVVEEKEEQAQAELANESEEEATEKPAPKKAAKKRTPKAKK